MKDSKRIWYPGIVKRPDAGGTLYAPVDQDGKENGDTPSYDYEAVRRRCDGLNKVNRMTEAAVAGQLGERRPPRRVTAEEHRENLKNRTYDSANYREAPSASFPWLAVEVTTSGELGAQGRGARYYRSQEMALRWARDQFLRYAVGKVVFR